MASDSYNVIVLPRKDAPGLKGGGGDGAFDSMERRVEALEKRMDRVEAKLDKLTETTAGLTTEVRVLAERVSHLRSSLSPTSKNRGARQARDADGARQRTQPPRSRSPQC